MDEAPNRQPEGTEPPQDSELPPTVQDVQSLPEPPTETVSLPEPPVALPDTKPPVPEPEVTLPQEPLKPRPAPPEPDTTPEPIIPVPTPQPPADLPKPPDPTPPPRSPIDVSTLTPEELKAAAVLWAKQNQRTLSQKGVQKRRQIAEENIRNITQFVTKHSPANNRTIARALNLPPRRVQHYMQLLTKRGVVSASGWGISREYRLK